MASTFPPVLAFAFILALLFLGAMTRRALPFFQRNLVPASLIGGIAGFLLVAGDLSMGYVSGDFTAIAFHAFTLSFMSLVLTSRTQSNDSSQLAWGGLWMSVIWVISLTLQALLGLLLIRLYNGFSSEQPLSDYLGMIITHGFTQGPGQAIALGSLWETSFDIQLATDFGLIYASLGFVAAFVIGVPVARWAMSQHLQQGSERIDAEFEGGFFEQPETHPAGHQISHPSNLDSLGFHLGLLGVSYLLTHGYLSGMQVLVRDTAIENIFSYNLFFFHGLMVCVILRRCLDAFKLGHLVDDETQKRITGTSVDIMVTATLVSVNFGLLSTYWMPILWVALGITIATALLCLGAGRRLKTFGLERGLTSFGCCCGSTGTGILLLRILDPHLASPVAKELAFFNIAIVFLSFHILGIMAPILPSIPLVWTILIYGATAALGGLALLKLGSVINRPQAQ